MDCHMFFSWVWESIFIIANICNSKYEKDFVHPMYYGARGEKSLVNYVVPDKMKKNCFGL